MCKQDAQPQPQPQPQRQDKYQYQLYLKLDDGTRYFPQNANGTAMVFTDQQKAIEEAGFVADWAGDQVGVQVTIPLNLDLSDISPRANWN